MTLPDFLQEKHKIKNVTRKTKTEELPDLDYLLRWVSWYRTQGLNVIALPIQSKGAGADAWKQYQQRKATDEEVTSMFSQLSNIALINGKTSRNSVTLDIDDKKTFEKLVADLPETFTVQTFRGIHLHYTTDILPQKANTKIPEFHIEILSQGSIAVLPPSIHEEGYVYKPYQGSKKPDNNKPITHIEGDFEQWIYDIIRTRLDRKFMPKKEIVNIDKIMQGVEEGQRNWAAIRLATWYRRSGIDYESCTIKMEEWNQKNKPPCEGEDFTALQHTIRQAYKPEEPYRYWYTRQPQQTTVFTPEIKAKAEEIIEKDNILEAISEIASLYHAGDKDIIKAEWISAINSVSEDPAKINCWAIGKSQKGKSHSMYTTIMLLPREYYEVFTSASPLSLFYYVFQNGENSLDKKLLFIDEVESSKMAEPMLRSLTGQTNITPRHLSVHEAELLDLKIKGKRSVWFTSVKTFGTEQIKNRFIHLNPDESVEQDEKVWQLQDEIWRQGKQPQETQIQLAQAITQNIVENTQKMKVNIPSEIEWPYKERRWLYPVFLAFVNAITRINYKHRKIKDDTIEATPEDFQTAKNLWTTFGETLIYRVSRTALQILDVLSDNPEEAMTHEEISHQIPLSTRQIQTLCSEMVDEGLLNARKREQGDKRGRGAWEYWKAHIPSIEQITLKHNTIFGNQVDTKNENEKINLKPKPISENADHRENENWLKTERD